MARRMLPAGSRAASRLHLGLPSLRCPRCPGPTSAGRRPSWTRPTRPPPCPVTAVDLRPAVAGGAAAVPAAARCSSGTRRGPGRSTATRRRRAPRAGAVRARAGRRVDELDRPGRAARRPLRGVGARPARVRPVPAAAARAVLDPRPRARRRRRPRARRRPARRGRRARRCTCSATPSAGWSACSSPPGGPTSSRSLTLISPAMPVYRVPPAFSRALLLLLLPGVPSLAERRLAGITPEQNVRAMIRMCFGEPDRVPRERVEQAVEEMRERAEQPWADRALTRSMRGLITSYLRVGRANAWRVARVAAAADARHLGRPGQARRPRAGPAAGGGHPRRAAARARGRRPRGDARGAGADRARRARHGRGGADAARRLTRRAAAGLRPTRHGA